MSEIVGEHRALRESADVSLWAPEVGPTASGAIRWWHFETDHAAEELRALARTPEHASCLRTLELGTLLVPRGTDLRSVGLLCDGRDLITLGPLPFGIHDRVQELWTSKGSGLMCTGGDLALRVLDDVLAEHTLGRRYLAEQLAEIEDASVFTASGSDPSLAVALSDGRQRMLQLRRQITQRYRALEPVNIPGMERNPGRLAWFPGISSEEEAELVDEVLDRTLRGLRALRQETGDVMNMLATLTDAEQTRQTERLQLLIAVLGAIVVWPALVFGFYGANTNLPGRDRTSGLVAMLVLSTTGVVLLLLMIAWYRWRRRAGRPVLPRRRQSEPR